MMFKKLKWRGTGFCLILSIAGGCANVSPVRDYCLLYEPVYTSSVDTAETLRQTDRNNVVWLALCAQAPFNGRSATGAP